MIHLPPSGPAPTPPARIPRLPAPGRRRRGVASLVAFARGLLAAWAWTVTLPAPATAARLQPLCPPPSLADGQAGVLDYLVAVGGIVVEGDSARFDHRALGALPVGCRLHLHDVAVSLPRRTPGHRSILDAPRRALSTAFQIAAGAGTPNVAVAAWVRAHEEYNRWGYVRLVNRAMYAAGPLGSWAGESLARQVGFMEERTLRDLLRSTGFQTNEGDYSCCYRQEIAHFPDAVVLATYVRLHEGFLRNVWGNKVVVVEALADELKDRGLEVPPRQ